MKSRGQFRLLRQKRFAPYFVTQLFGAMNDHLFQTGMFALFTFGIAGLSAAQAARLSNLGHVAFVLPYLLLAAYAGQLAEKLEKSRLMRWTKLAEVGITLLGAAGFQLHSVGLLMAAIFLLGVRAILFGTLKFSMPPQLLSADELVGGNALIESSTTIMILLGSILGATLGPLAMRVVPVLGLGEVTHAQSFAYVGYASVGVALAGYWAACRMPPVAANAPELKFNWNPLGEALHNLGYLWRNRVAFAAVIGITWYWFYGTVLLTQLPNYTRHVLGASQLAVSVLLLVFSLGVGLGSLLCERLSGHRVEMGLVVLGAIGMSVFGVGLYLVSPSAPAPGEDLSSLGEFLRQPGTLALAVDLALLGLFSGFYIVPLYALVQSRTERSHLARVVAANNLLISFFGIAAALSAIRLLEAGFSIPQLWLAAGLANAAVVGAICLHVPEFWTRFLVWSRVRGAT